jgi:hypothetical protein
MTTRIVMLLSDVAEVGGLGAISSSSFPVASLL